MNINEIFVITTIVRTIGIEPISVSKNADALPLSYLRIKGGEWRNPLLGGLFKRIQDIFYMT